MKIDRLKLLAYGTFTDAALDFTGDRALHLVYGPNEAGKSTALRALRNLFFGIPARTPDSFRHPHPKLRIGAELTRSDGRTIAFVRRKGLRKTLRGADDRTPLADDALAAFLGGVERDLFEQMFAIGHQDLIAGGEEIAAGGGRLGEALFAAGAGLIRLQQYQQQLDQSLEALFKPAGSKPHINRTVARLKDVRARQKAAQLLAQDWETQHRNLREGEERQAVATRRLAALRQHYNKLERIHEALPLIARRREILETLPGMAGVPDLPEDFAENRRRAENEHIIAGNEVNRAEAALRDIREKMAASSVPEALLQQAPLVEELQHELGSTKKARRDRPGLEARMHTLRRQAAAKLAEAGMAATSADNDALRLPPAWVRQIQELGKSHERLITRMSAARQRRRDLAADIASSDEERQALPAPKDIRPLEAALQHVVDQGPLEKQLAEARHAVAQGDETLTARLKRQNLWSGTIEDLETLPCPSRETIDRFEERFIAATRSAERLREDRRQATATLREIDTELRSIEKDRHVPGEGDLEAARALRNHGWQLARRQLEGDGADADAVDAFVRRMTDRGSLADAFEAAMGRADHLADRLRREAEQVSRKSLLEARRRQAEDQRDAASAALEAADAAQAGLEREWRSLWTPLGIHPLPPAEMRSWRAEMRAMQDKAADLRAARQRADALATAVAASKDRLRDALNDTDTAPPPDTSLTEMTDMARRQVACHEERRAAIERIDHAVTRQRKEWKKVCAELDALEKEHHDWEAAWARTVAPLGPSAEAGPAAALAMIDAVREAQARRHEADELAERIADIDRDTERFERRVAQLVERLAPDLASAPPEEACLRLYALLTEGRAEQSRQSALARQEEGVAKDLDAARQRLEKAGARIQALCREAGESAPEKLPAIEKQAQRRLALRRENDELENRLRHLSAGATVDAFVADAGRMAADALAPEMERIAGEIAALENERSQLDQAIGTAGAELRRMDGRADAAGHAEEAEHLLGALDADVVRYTRLKIAAGLLARTIERYREKHQGPLIQRAGALFARMTRQAFSGLRAEYDTKGRPVLMGLRSGDEELVGVTGMSDGTADQLYLALRLASLERYLGAGEPLPFVVDDILVRFDDDRAAATLEVLAELTRLTQVIFFTHHHHLVTLARKTLSASTLHVHRLADRPPSASVN